ncbi:hypothetical protein E2542_SST15481 [Spatholobus suberectus]|nr:hypothetical protein E2542_SST15481 [Spatholobus suberectus]
MKNMNEFMNPEQLHRKLEQLPVLMFVTALFLFFVVPQAHLVDIYSFGMCVLEIIIDTNCFVRIIFLFCKPSTQTTIDGRPTKTGEMEEQLHLTSFLAALEL